MPRKPVDPIPKAWAKGRRFSIYIPEDLMPEVQPCLEKGRVLQEMLFGAAAGYAKTLKAEKDKSTGRQEN
jgi:hypothetical protein